MTKRLLRPWLEIVLGLLSAPWVIAAMFYDRDTELSDRIMAYSPVGLLHPEWRK